MARSYEERVRRLDSARLYFVCDGLSSRDERRRVFGGALEAGAEIIQLRDRGRPTSALLELGVELRALADEYGALFFVNDDPDLAARLGADGVHVGQDDLAVALARVRAGDGAVVGLSTHRPAELDAAEASRGASRPDYISVGPLYATPTKPGRAATGLSYARYAATEATLRWFAIGGLDLSTCAEVIAIGARRMAVVRAIRDAANPADAASQLLASLSRAAPLEAVGAR